jgi:hypothetical protein
MAENRISESLDTYFDRTRKTISQWVTAHINSELSKVNGSIILPIKKPLQDIYDYVMLDAHLTSVVQQRVSKVLGEEFAIMDSNGNIDDELTKQFSKQWFGKVQKAIIDTKLYGYNLIEIQELIDNEIRDVKIVSRGNVIPEMKAVIKNPYQVSLASLISLENRNDSDYYVLVDSETLGLLNQVVPLVMIKRLTTSMWGEHSQSYGLPMTILKSDNTDQVHKYQQDMQRFIQNRNIVIGLSDSLEVTSQSGSDPHKIYLELINNCNAEISKAVIGQTMTTDNGSSRSQSEVHERVANEISEADREYMTYVINDLVFPKLIALGYRLENATFKFIFKEKRTYQEKLDTIKNLKDTGYAIDPDDVKQYLDLPFDVETVDESSVMENSFKKKL